jgi:cell division septum initiation protein DivIVA
MTEDELVRIGRLLNHADMDSTDVTRLIRSFMIRALDEARVLATQLAVANGTAEAQRHLADERQKRIETLEREAFLAATMTRETVAERDTWEATAKALRLVESRISGILCDAGGVVDPLPEGVAALVKERDALKELLVSQ